ncbi:MAG TPA: asparagine synthase-related protein [Nitrososphaera sp.]|nr:asparagine synthase-related protein [Nitrososphaera sp.]
MKHCEELTKLLTESVKRNHSDALLLSGGLDSSILASILHPEYSIVVGFGGSAPDLAYARQVAERYCKHHVEIVFEQSKMTALVEEVIQIFKTFDPIEIRNSAVALAGLEWAKSDGYSSIMTGDGSDELFAGYNYLSRYYTDMQQFDSELRRLWQMMHFSSRKLGEHVRIEVKSPFLDDKFVSFAKLVSPNDKVGEHEGKKWGKFILRKCFEPALGSLVWRPKLAQEQGAATDRYQKYIEEMIDNLTFENKKKIAEEQESVRIRSKEHLHYYAIFRSYFPPPKEEQGDDICSSRCSECRGCIPSDTRFCRKCGAFPVVPVSL